MVIEDDGRSNARAWKWYDITSLEASVGGTTGDYYGGVQVRGDGFYGLLKFRREGPMPDATAPTTYGRRCYGHLHIEQMAAAIVDLLRTEKPVRFDWYEKDPNRFHLMTGSEPVGDGELAEDADD